MSRPEERLLVLRVRRFPVDKIPKEDLMFREYGDHCQEANVVKEAGLRSLRWVGTQEDPDSFGSHSRSLVETGHEFAHTGRSPLGELGVE